jgi:hypothetical protein
MGLFGNTQQAPQNQGTQNQAPQNQGAPPLPADPNEAVAAADPQGNRTPYIGNGTYLLAFDFAKWNRKDNGLLAFIAEMEILESTNPEHPVGTRGTYYREMNYPGDRGQVKSFIAALANEDHTAVTKQAMDLLLSPQNPAHGRLVRCTAANKQGKLYTYYNWTPVPDEMQAQAAQLRQQAGFDTPF